MKKIVILASLIMSGCAATHSEIELDYPVQVAQERYISVKDGRLDKQVYMNAITHYSTAHTYLLEPSPTIDKVIQSKLNHYFSHNKISKPVEITVDELDVKNIVGFAKADKLTCRIKSTIKRVDAGNANSKAVAETFCTE